MSNGILRQGLVRRWAPLLIVFGMPWSTVSAQVVERPAAYVVRPVTFLLRAGDVVGPKRLGSLCLPSGSVSWQEAKPDGYEARLAIAQGLRDGGLDVAPDEDDGPDPAHGQAMISAVVQAIRLSACVPPGGLGRLLNHSRTIKGQGVIAIRWRVQTGLGAAATEVSTCTPFPFRQLRGSIADATMSGLTIAATALARHVNGAPPTPPPEEPTCRSISSLTPPQ